MAYLILPSMWRQQPQYPVRIDWSNPLARGLAFASVGGSFANTEGKVSANKINLVSGADGRSYRNDGTNELNWGSQFGLDAVSKNISVFARGALTANTAAGIPICGTRGTGGFGFLLDTNAGGDFVPLNFILWGVAGQASTANADFFNGGYGQYFSIAATHQPNTTAGLNFYFRGKSLGAAVNTGVPAASSANLAILGRGDGTYLPTTYDLSIVALWTRILSAAEIAALDANPWQLFRAAQRRIYVSVGGGTQFTLTLSASVTASSVLSRSIVATRSASTTAVASATRTDAKTFAASSTASATVQPLKAILRSLSASSTLSAALTRQAQVVRQASSIMSSTVSRAVAVTRSAATTSAAALVRQGQRSLAASTSIAALIVRQAGKSLASSTTLSAALATLKQAGGLTLTAATTVSAALARSTAKTAIAGLGQLVTLVLPSGTATVSGWLHRARRHLTR